MKKILYSVLFLITTFVGAEQITKVAILDYARILSTFYADSAEARRLERMKKDFAKNVQNLQQEIQSLEEQKINAENGADSLKALELDSRIQKKKQFYQEFIRVRGNQIQQSESKMSSSKAMANEILKQIQFVAESNGFSIVLKRSNPNLLWWSYQTDITDLVLERLMANNQE